jgi:hypothetical protein
VLVVLTSGCFRSATEEVPATEPAATAIADEDQADQASEPDADTPVLPDGAGAEAIAEEPIKEPVKRMDPPAGARRLDPEFDVWIDPDRKSVIMDGFVSFREGPLEMFACTRGTKEHESIVSVHTKAFLVHAALLNVGAETGSPVQFLPDFRPPTGTEVAIEVVWVDEEGERHTAKAQDWIRDARTGEAMQHPWVFAGSGFWKDDQTGRSHYQAEGGDFICVSNFASAMLDIPVESTQANEGLAFEAFTERIPPLGTHVRLILTPQLPEAARQEAEKDGDPPTPPTDDLDG